MNEKMTWSVKTLSSFAVILSALFTGIGWINSQYVNYLERHFALREDFARLEQKVDMLVAQGIKHEKNDK